jgi:uncharacterized protein (UPF0218 family)
MTIVYALTPELRAKLKNPLGDLIRGSFDETIGIFKNILLKETPPKVISIGDTVSRNLLKNGVIPDLMVIDNIAMRKATQPISFRVEKTIHVNNPAGTITDEAITAIQDALKGETNVKIVVNGEEDLLTLIAVECAPDDSIVLYGQPYEGIVAVKATLEKKREIADILSVMEPTRKTK